MRYISRVIRSYVVAHTPARHDVPLAAEAQLMASVKQQRRLLQAPLWRDGIAVQPSRERQSCSPVLPEDPL